MKNVSKLSTISLSSIITPSKPNWLWRGICWLGDRVMGLHKLQRLYEKSELPGLPKQAFAEQLFTLFGVDLKGFDALKQKLPETGPVVLVCNHPFGCIEGVALANELSKIRPDVKVLANKALAMFKEIESHFIFINPLSANDPRNISALKQCKTHLKNDGVLLIFPAGKVSYYRPELGRITDGDWNRLPAQLARSLDVPVLPLFIEGHNSRFFINMGRIYYRFKPLLLFREMLKRKNQTLEVKVGNLLTSKLLSKLKDLDAINHYLRLQVYNLASSHRTVWPPDQVLEHKPLHPPIDRDTLRKEIEALPESQHLVDYKGFQVFWSRQAQTPNVVTEIARLRELVFRQHNEGSGEPLDTDKFDATYLHLFIFQPSTGDIIGAYRMGQSDVLIANGGLEALYLSRMFDFKSGFINRNEPCLEMGRSFIVPEHQRSFYGLFLLWRGIGEFVVRHPQYRYLYGTVSLSKLYDPLSVHCIDKLSLTPSDQVAAKSGFSYANYPELDEFISRHQSRENLLAILLQGIESDGKEQPILMKQYEKLAARFYCIGIDQNFNHTPGLLLSVHLPSAPNKALIQYLADGVDGYLRYSES